MTISQNYHKNAYLSAFCDSFMHKKRIKLPLHSCSGYKFAVFYYVLVRTTSVVDTDYLIKEKQLCLMNLMDTIRINIKRLHNK